MKTTMVLEWRYRAHQHERYLHSSTIVIFIDEDYLEE